MRSSGGRCAKGAIRIIQAEEAIRTARTLLGTPYGDMDCIALIRAVIRRSAGGIGDYRCEGTNWLWRSINNSGKYRHLIWQQEGIDGARAGMLAFKRSGEDIHHVGLVTQVGTVIHASSAAGCVVETALDGSWHLLGRHRHIETADVQTEGETDDCTRGEAAMRMTTLINREDGSVIRLCGDWRAAQD